MPYSTAPGNPPQTKILVVDDEENMCEILQQILSREGYTISTATTGRNALEMFRNNTYQMVIQDLKLPDANGLDLVRKYKELNPSVMVVIITAFSTWQKAVEAMRLGAYDYLQKPFDNENIKTTIRRALLAQQFLNTSKDAKDKRPLFRPFIGNNLQIQKIYQLIEQIAITDCTVLIQGENGTGKELIARILHYHSARAFQPFMTVNCGAFPENLLESELFGHLKGSFTTALYDKKGLLEVADKGSFFLDEVSELSPALQVKLLRVIEEREFRPVGGTENLKVDVRFIAATNTNLDEGVRNGNFRQDLFYRLNVVMVNLPPLRERRDDIPLLAGHFLAKYTRLLNKAITGFSPATLELLINYDWPGNVRELENVIQRAVILSKEQLIEPTELTTQLQGKWDISKIDDLSDQGIDLEKRIRVMEIFYIQQALKSTEGNITKSARLLNLPERALRYKIKKYGIRRI